MSYAIHSDPNPCLQFTPANDAGDELIQFAERQARALFQPIPTHLALAVPVRRNMREIVAAVSARHGLRTTDVLSQSRARPYAHARQDIMLEAFETRNFDGSKRYSLPQIAREISRLGDRPEEMDHTTVIHGIRKAKARRRARKLAEVRAENERLAAIHGAA